MNENAVVGRFCILFDSVPLAELGATAALEVVPPDNGKNEEEEDDEPAVVEGAVAAEVVEVSEREGSVLTPTFRVVADAAVEEERGVAEMVLAEFVLKPGREAEAAAAAAAVAAATAAAAAVPGG